MHIPDGYLSPQTFIPAYGGYIPLLLYGFKRVKKNLKNETLPFIASLTALSFIIMMFNIPVPGGTSGHAIGAAVIAILFGPWIAFLSLSTVLFIQALLFGDGGITSFPINAFSMGFVTSFTAYYTFYFLKTKIYSKAAAFIAGWSSIVFAAISTSFFLGIQPILAKDALGYPLYFPFDLHITFPAIVLTHILFLGLVEGIFTVLAIKTIKNINPEFEKKYRIDKILPKKIFIVLSILILLIPLGLLSNSPAWGEWAQPYFKNILGFVPNGIHNFSNFYLAPLTDYNLNNFNTVFGYYISAILGSVLIFLIFYIILIKPNPNKQKDKLFFFGYLLLILLFSILKYFLVMLSIFLTIYILSGKKRNKILKQSVGALLIFNTTVIIAYTVYSIQMQNFSFHTILILTMRTLGLSYLTFFMVEKINLFSVFSFSKALNFLLVVSYSQIMAFKKTFNDFQDALKSRIIVKPINKDIYKFISSTINFFVLKTLSNSREIFLALESRGFFYD